MTYIRIAKIKDTLRPVKYFLYHLLSRWGNKAVVKKSLGNDSVYVELGASRRNIPGWISLDLCRADINLDLTKQPLPFPDNSVDRFYSSHVFEHFSYPEPMIAVLKECYRCLKLGGVFSVCVPNAAMYVDAYLKGEYPSGDFYKPAFHQNSRMDILNYVAYMDGHHKHLFDLEGLLNVLQIVGFKNARQRDFDPSIDLESRKWESIYAVANK